MTDLATDLARAYDAARQLADAMRRGHCATTAGHLDQAARCLASACGQARIATQAEYDRDSRRTIPALIIDLERIREQLELGSMLRMTLGTAQGYARDAQRSLNRGGVLVDVGGPMTRAELIRKIKELAVEAEAANEQAAAGVLWGLIGALAVGHDAALAHHVADFARGALSAINARWN